MVLEEIDLVRKVQNERDMAAFQRLVCEHQERIYYLVRRMVGNHEDAQDLVQDTFIKSLTKIGQIKDGSKFGGWLSNIAVNTALDFFRKKNNNGKISLSDEVSPEVISEKLIQKNEESKNGAYEQETKKHISRALMKLPLNHREAFLLFHYQKLPVKIVADHMGCPEATVRSYVFRAVKKLRVYLQDYKELTKG